MATPHEKVAISFTIRVQKLIRDYNELIVACNGKVRQQSLESMLSEQTALSLGVQWESFINDLITAYVHEEPASCFTHFETRIAQSINEKFAGVAKWIKWEFPDDISLAMAEKIIDPLGRNVSATSAQALSELANKWLDAPIATKFSLPTHDREFLDYQVCLRNYLAHRSTDARTKLINCIAAIDTGGPNSSLHSTARRFEVGTYLKTAVTGGTRVTFIAQRILQLTAHLT